MLFLGNSFGVVIYVALNEIGLAGRMFSGLKRRVVLVFNQLSSVVKCWVLRATSSLGSYYHP